jgi:transposase InsO family protein
VPACCAALMSHEQRLQGAAGLRAVGAHRVPGVWTSLGGSHAAWGGESVGGVAVFLGALIAVRLLSQVVTCLERSRPMEVNLKCTAGLPAGQHPVTGGVSVHRLVWCWVPAVSAALQFHSGT